VATISAIVHAGATPVLVDVGDDFTMDMEQVEKAITPRTRAVMPVHLNGRACNVAQLLEIAQRHNLLVIEDGAQALGAEFRHKRVGSFGSAGCFSLYPFKMLGAFGDGGIVTTNDASIARELTILRDYGEDRETGEVLHFGFNSRLDNVQAAMLNVKLKYFDQWIDRRRAIARVYDKRLADIRQIKLPPSPDAEHGDVYMNYALRAERRDELVRFLKHQGIEPLTPLSLVTPVHQHKAWKFGYLSLPRTEAIAKQFLYLPVSPELMDEQVEYVAGCIRRFYESS
jgi:dTDP-4-amino-4,6-dideoxygalactose transaminase